MCMSKAVVKYRFDFNEPANACIYKSHPSIPKGREEEKQEQEQQEQDETVACAHVMLVGCIEV